MSSDRYPFREIEAKWQRIWDERRQYRAVEDPGRPKFYCLEMFPYPSGRIHMGHVRNYAIGDLLARFKRMRGFNVLHPMGWDAFGLPAENAAIEHGVHPAIWTHENIRYMRNQLKQLGLSYDWDREITTCEPAYYKWEQLIFIRMLERGLAGRPALAVRVFTTRPDTVFGMTYAVLAPEHPLVDQLVADGGERAAVERFRAEVARETEIERLATDRPKRGLRLRARVVNPFTGAEVPLFIADYVVMAYGTGAIMAVPGEDQRDWDFAVPHGLPIVETVARPAGFRGQAYTGDGTKINSGFLDGLSVAAAKRKAVEWLEANRLGEGKVNYRLRDWGISRQRYWGAPIPVLYCDRDGMVPEKEENLPVVLPENVQISGKGGSPLADVPSFVNARCPRCGGPRQGSRLERSRRRGRLALPEPGVAVHAGARGRAPAGGARTGRRALGPRTSLPPERPRDDRPRDRRHRERLPLQHRDQRDHGARQRAPCV